MTNLRRLAILALVLSTFVPTSALAQARVVLMSSAAERDALAPTLAAELAARGATLVVTDTPAGSTRVARGASAQTLAQQIGAVAAVWPDAIESTAGPISIVSVAPSVDRDPRQALLQAPPVTNPRAFASLAVELMGDLLAAPQVVAPPAPVFVQPPPAHPTAYVTAAPAPMAPAPVYAPTPVYATQPVLVDPPSTQLDEPELRERDVAPFGQLQALAGGFVADPYSIGFGGLRGALGLRLGVLRLALEGDVASMLHQSELSPFIRLGASVTFELPLGPLRFIVGAQARSLLSELVEYDWESDWRSGQWVWGFTGGARAALAIPLAHALDLELGTDIDIAFQDRGRVSFAPTAFAGITWR